MTTVRTVATHDIVEAVYPHPVTERDELGIAAGRAIDGALSRYSQEFRDGRRPTASSMRRFAGELLDDGLAESGLRLEPAVLERELAQIAAVLQAFRTSELMGLLRPRSRLVLLDETVGFYAQPDYWNGRDRFYEMKSYRADPLPPAVELQLQLFQLAFPGYRAFLACFDRHTSPVVTSVSEFAPMESATAERLLRVAHRTGRELGTEKVLEYIDSPTVRYSLPP